MYVVCDLDHYSNCCVFLKLRLCDILYEQMHTDCDILYEEKYPR